MTSEHLGSIDRHGSRTTLSYRRQLHRQRDGIWRALTDSEQLRSWLPIDIIGSSAAESTVQLRFWPDVADHHDLDPDPGDGTILVWEPPTVFEWTWNDSIIRFEIDGDAAGSELSLSVDIGTTKTDAVIDNAAGYHLWMDHITRVLDTGESPSIAHDAPDALERQYRLSLDPDDL